MSITHIQAHRLIQLRLDHSLNAQELGTLSEHLEECTECQAYANELKEVERYLAPMMKKQWNLRPLPLSIPALMGNTIRAQTNTLLTMRKAILSLAFVALFFSAWQFVISAGPSAANPISLSAPPVPTPLAQTAQSTSTEISLENCEMIVYTVQGQDALAEIAARFSVPEAWIMAANNLGTESISALGELIIPICHSTPTGTAHPATFTTTYTPILKFITSTPDG